MSDFVLSGGCRWNDTCVADVTMDAATGDPLTCCNPITGVCLGGGAAGYATANVKFVNGAATSKTFYAAFLDEENSQTIGVVTVAASTDVIAKVIMYENKAIITPATLADYDTKSGAITFADGVFTVTGDGQINYTGMI